MNILISEIYINLEKIKKQIKESKFNENEKYYIINNTWFKYLKENYDYDIIINELNKNEKFKQYLEVLLNSDKNEFKKEIIKDILKDKNNNDKNINKEIKNEEIKNLEIENNFQKLKIENNEKIYLDKFIIINDRIKELFETIFKIKANEKLFLRLKCIIKNMNKTLNKNFIYVFYSLKNMFFANIGNLDEKEFLYETVSFLEINNQEYFEELYKKKELINNEIEKKFESLLTDNKDNKIFLTIEDDNKNAKAIIYLIKKIEIKNQINNNTNNSLPKLDKNINNNNPSSMTEFLFRSKTCIYEKKIIIPENLVKDIKILIKYLLFKKELNRKYNFPKLFKNCYLINVIIWSKYKSFLFYKKLIDIVEEETKNLTPINNKPINSNESLINKIYESLVKLFKSNKELYESKNIDSVQSYLDKQINFEITMDYKNLNEKSIYYPTNFEIVDQYILDDMIKRNVIQNNHYLKSDIIVNNEKVLINCEQYQKGNQNNIILLVGNLTPDSDFILKKLINFPEEKVRKEFFDNFIKENYENIINKYAYNLNNILISQSHLQNNFTFIDYKDICFKFDEKNIGNKLIKFFLLLYLFENNINQDLVKNISANGNRIYYFINKGWMEIYKENYDYKKLCSLFDSIKKNKTYNYNYTQLVESIRIKNVEKTNEFIYELTKNIPIDNLKNLEIKKSNQTNLIKTLNNKLLSVVKAEKNTGNKNIDYIGENIFISDYLFELFLQIETANLAKLIKTYSIKKECLIGENKLYIKSETNENNNSNIKNYFLNVGYIKDKIFKPSLIIFYNEKKDFDDMINSLNTKLFSEYIESYYNLIDKFNCDIKNKSSNIIGKIFKIEELSSELKNIILNANKINQESMKLLKLITYLKKFNNEKDLPFKISKESTCHFVKPEFINVIQKIPMYKFIEDYINKNNDIQDLINNNKNISINDLSNAIEKKFNKNIIKEINSKPVNININCSSYKVSPEQISLNRNKYIKFENNCILLDNEIYNIFDDKWFKSQGLNYLLGEKKILIINDTQEVILEYTINEKNELNLELILYYDSDKNNKINKNYILNQIKEDGFSQFRKYLLFDNDNFSPIFDINQTKIGMAYNYPLPKERVDFNTYINVRKIFELYLNYKKMPNKNNTFFEYNIVNKDWIQTYKNFYDFDLMYKEIEGNKNIEKVINSLKEEECINKFISDKKLTLMIKALPKNIFDKMVKNENVFESKYKNEKQKTPIILPLSYINENREEISFFYYENFEIIDSKIYKKLLQNINKNIKIGTTIYGTRREMEFNEEEKINCLFDKSRIIFIPMNNPNKDKKYYLYIGQIKPSFIFDIECIIIYDSKNLMDEHIQKVINSTGFNDFYEDFSKQEINTLEINLDNKTYGLAVKKKQNPDWNPKYDDNDMVSQYFQFAPKVGLANIGATCYMNATLQCFCQIEEFTSYFKYHSHVKNVIQKYNNISQKCLTTSFKTLIENIWPGNAMKVDSSKRFYEPHDFRQKIAEMSPLFENVGANDAKDLVNFIIMTLHEELNEPLPKINNLIINNQEDPNDVFNVFSQDYQNDFRSKISELFYAIQKTQTTCLNFNCGKVQYNFQAYFFLVFPLEEVRKYSINKILNPQNNNSSLMNNNQFGMFPNTMNNISNINPMNNFGMNAMNSMGNINPMNNFGMNAMNSIGNINNMNMNGMNGMNSIGNINNMNMNGMNGMNNMNNYNMLNSMNNIQNFNNNMNYMQMNNNYNMYSMMQMGMMNNNFGMNNLNPFSQSNLQGMNNYGIININMPNNTNNFMNQNINMNNNPDLQKLNNNIVNIMQCFEYNQKIDKFTGSDQIYCNKCNQMADANYVSTLETAPKILILLLNRGTGLQFKVKLEFTEILDISKYVSQQNGNGVKYKLIGVITHLGLSGEDGHFIAHCLSPIDKKWYTYNDAIVHEIKDYQKEIIDLGMPYLLFYKRIDEQIINMNNINNNINQK